MRILALWVMEQIRVGRKSRNVSIPEIQNNELKEA